MKQIVNETAKELGSTTGDFNDGQAQNQMDYGSSCDSTTKLKVVESYGKLPLSFIGNEEQVNKEVQYYLKGREGTIYFTKEAVVYDLLSGNASLLEETNPKDFKRLSFTLKPIGAKKEVPLLAEDKLPGKVNYFIGNDPEKWQTDIPIYREIVYKDLYKGIDLKVYGTNNQMEYDFIIYPGADPKAIKMAFEGIVSLSIDKEGNLVIKTPLSELKHLKPLIYQEIDGKHHVVEGSFKVAKKKNSFSFDVKEYNKNYPLIIDPVTLSYSTYLGGSGYDNGYGIAVDSSKNVYVTGMTRSSDFPTKNAYRGTHGGEETDAFVTKLVGEAHTEPITEDFDDGQAQNWIGDGSGCWGVQETSPNKVYVMTGNKGDTGRYSHYNQEFCGVTYQADVRKVAGNKPKKAFAYNSLFVRFLLLSHAQSLPRLACVLFQPSRLQDQHIPRNAHHYPQPQ